MKENTNKERDSRFSLEEQIKAAKFIGEEIGFSKDIGLEVLEVSEGYCKGRIALHKRHMNPLNTLMVLLFQNMTLLSMVLSLPLLQIMQKLDIKLDKLKIHILQNKEKH